MFLSLHQIISDLIRTLLGWLFSSSFAFRTLLGCLYKQPHCNSENQLSEIYLRVILFGSSRTFRTYQDYSCGVHPRLIKRISITVCGVFAYQGSCLSIGSGSRFHPFIPRFLPLYRQRVAVFIKSDRRTILGFPYCCWVSLFSARFASSGIRALFYFSGLPILVSS